MSASTGQPAGTDPIRIFISYRRDDTAPYAGRLYDALSDHFGEANVFMDIDTMEPGAQFTDVISRAVGSCDVLIALIGRQWLAAVDTKGRRRLDRSDDFVRLEIEAVLDRSAVVIPALVQDTEMPPPEELPPSLAELSRRQAAVLSDRRWRSDVANLMSAIERAAATLRAIDSSRPSEDTPAGEGTPTTSAAISSAERVPTAPPAAQDALAPVALAHAIDDERAPAGEPEAADKEAFRELLPSWRPAATALTLAGILLLVLGNLIADGNGDKILGHNAAVIGVRFSLAIRPVVMSLTAILALWALYRGARARTVGAGAMLGLGTAAAVGYLDQALFSLHSLGSLKGPNQGQAFVCFLGASCLAVAGLIALSGPWERGGPGHRWVDRRPVLAVIGGAIVLLGAVALFLPLAFWTTQPDNPVSLLVFVPELLLVAVGAALIGRSLIRSGMNLAALGGTLVGLALDGFLVGFFFFESQVGDQYIFNKGDANWKLGGMLVMVGGLVIAAGGVLVALARRTGPAEA